MGNTRGSSSWFNLMRKVFRFPNQDSEQRSCKSRDDDDQHDEEKRRGKQKWLFGRTASNKIKGIHHPVLITTTESSNNSEIRGGMINSPHSATDMMEMERRTAMAVAMASTAAAEAAVATAQAAVEFIRLTRPSMLIRENHAAMVIQTAFRGYLARRALRALKGLVKLQALVRGHNVRKRTIMTLQSMQAIVRVQAQVCEQRRRMSLEEAESIKSGFAMESNKPARLSSSRKGTSNIGEEWVDPQHVVKEISSLLQRTKKAGYGLQRFDYASSPDKIWRHATHGISEDILEETSPWISLRRSKKQRERAGRYSCDQRHPVKDVEIGHINSYSTSNLPQATYEYYQDSANSNISSPINVSPQNILHLSRLKHHQYELQHLTTHSPSPHCSGAGTATSTTPSYMAATESAKARIRSLSTPRLRAMMTPEREFTGSAKRQLFFGTSCN
ncbi:hypothetical protein Droror1_Dr00009405 [Drosera rotundifolia]